MTSTPPQALITSYDEVPYDGLSHSHTHPNLLGVVGALLGMDPAPPQACRVLEIGCAQGYNLIPMALGLPESDFVGVDYAAAQIRAGQEAVEQLGVANVTLLCRDVMDLDPKPGQDDELGRFDYIIAHGFYSWTPPDVRDRLLALCRRLLAPQGIAFISYNAYPGAHFLDGLRSMMLHHVARYTEPLTRAQEARKLIEALNQAADTPVMPFSGFYAAFRQLIHDYHAHLGEDGKSDALLLHDELEAINQPVYLHQFVDHCAQHGLQYLGDAEFASMMAANLPAQVTEFVQQSAQDRVEVEQYLDFVRNRMFRRSLICHKEVPLGGQGGGSGGINAVQRFAVSSGARAEKVERPPGARPAYKFIGPSGSSIATDHPVTIEAFQRLRSVWPDSIAFDDLLEAAAQGVRSRGEATDPTRDRQVLAANLLKAYATSPILVEFLRHAPRLSCWPTRRPRASRWARWQARHNQVQICNLLHKRVLVDPFLLFLLVRLDGSRTQEMLVQACLDGPLADGLWRLGSGDDDSEADSLDPALSDAEKMALVVQNRLEWLATAALLEA